MPPVGSSFSAQSALDGGFVRNTPCLPARSTGASSPIGLPPGLEILARLLLGCGIKPQDGTALEHLLSHEILKSGHLNCLVRDLVSEVRGNDHNSLAIANDHITGKDRRIGAAGVPIR